MWKLTQTSKRLEALVNSEETKDSIVALLSDKKVQEDMLPYQAHKHVSIHFSFCFSELLK